MSAMHMPAQRSLITSCGRAALQSHNAKSARAFNQYAMSAPGLGCVKTRRRANCGERILRTARSGSQKSKRPAGAPFSCGSTDLPSDHDTRSSMKRQPPRRIPDSKTSAKTVHLGQSLVPCWSATSQAENPDKLRFDDPALWMSRPGDRTRPAKTTNSALNAEFVSDLILVHFKPDRQFFRSIDEGRLRHLLRHRARSTSAWQQFLDRIRISSWQGAAKAEKGP